MRLSALSIPIATILLTTPAKADDLSRRVRLFYSLDASAAASCPNEAAFRSAVVERLGRSPFWEWAPNDLLVLVTSSSSGYSARIVTVDSTGASFRRDLGPEPDCAQVITTAAFMVSIALTPHPTPEPDQKTKADVEGPPKNPLPPVTEEVTRPKEANLTQEDTDRLPHRKGIGAIVSTLNGTSPSLLFAGGAFLDFHREAFSFGVELQGAISSPVERIQIAAATSNVLACAHFRVPFACVLGRFGWMQAWTDGTPSDGSPFVAVGARFGAEVELSSRAFVRISSDLVIEPYGPRFSTGTSYVGNSEIFRAQEVRLYASSIGAALNMQLGYYVP